MLKGWTPKLHDQVTVLAPVCSCGVIMGSSLTSLSHNILEILVSLILGQYQNYRTSFLEYWTAIPIVFQAQFPFLRIVVKERLLGLSVAG